MHFYRCAVLVAASSCLLLRADSSQILQQYTQLPLAFEPNLGQSDARVQYIARSAGYTLALKPSEAVMVLSPRAKKQAIALRMTVDGGDLNAPAVPLDRQPGISAYFIGNDPSRWLPEVPHYSRVQFQSVYPGIDLVYYGEGRQVEYDFVVAPGADPARIRLSYQGAESMRIDSSGDLVLTTDLGEFRQRRPRVYQEVRGRRVEVPTTYRLNGRQVGFELGRYDRGQGLVIDPVFVYSTYLGGNVAIEDMAMDSTGAVYVTGRAAASVAQLPEVNAFQSNPQAFRYTAFVTKLNAYPGSGKVTLAYSSFLGGTSGYDAGVGIAVDHDGAAYVSGNTQSGDFPIVNAYLPFHTGGFIGFLTKLNPYNGSGKVTLGYSTFLGKGSFGKVAVDRTGAAYVPGRADSTTFPSLNGQPVQAGDSFVARFNPHSGTGDVTLGYCTSLGSVNLTTIALDTTAAVYAAGIAVVPPPPFPPVRTVNAFQSAPPGYIDGFIAKLNPYGAGPVTVVYATFLGGSGNDFITGITADSTGAAYVVGRSDSADLPVTNAWRTSNAGNMDVFVAKLNPLTGSGPVGLGFLTYLGGGSYESANGIAVDSNRSVYVAGTTSSPDFPILDNSPRSMEGRWGDAFVTKFNQSESGALSLAYSTVFGGHDNTASANGDTDVATAIAIDRDGSIQVAGRTGSADFPLLNAFQTEFFDVVTDAGVDSDGMVVRLAQPGTVVKTPVSVTVSSPTIDALPAGTSIVFGQTLVVNAILNGPPGGPPIGGAVWFGGTAGTSICTAEVVNGRATCAVIVSTAFIPGRNTITVGYGGDSVYTLTGVVTPLVFTISPGATTTALAISPNPPVPGPVTLTATVSTVSPASLVSASGPLIFSRDGQPIPECQYLYPPSEIFCRDACTTQLTQFAVSCNTSLSDATTVFGASYGGNLYTSASIAPALTIKSSKATPSFVVGSSPSAPVYGQTVTFTVPALPGPGGVLPTGAITISDTIYGTQGASVTAPINSSGIASAQLNGLVSGYHMIQVSYAGDSVFAGGWSVTVPVLISLATTTTVLSAQADYTSTTFTATVAAMPPGAGMATGTVGFFSAGNWLGGANLVTTGGAATATLTLGFTTGTITAVYYGDRNFSSSTSSPITVLDNRRPQTSVSVLLSPSATTVTVGRPVVLSVNVAGSGSTALPTGAVQFFDYATLLGTVALSRGEASFSITFQTPGSHNITARYSGDSLYPAESGAYNLYVTLNPSSITLASSKPNSNAGEAIVFTAQVSGTPMAGVPAPTGTVQFLDGLSPIGTAPLVNGTASITVTDFVARPHRVVALYKGDSYWAASTAVLVQNVINADGTTAIPRLKRQH